MLFECRNVRQIPSEGHRRWFSDDYFDLIVWYDGMQSDRSHITGFQLCYNKGGYERALTWKRSGRFSHDAVDDGESGFGGLDQTPILVADGQFSSRSVADRFREASANIDGDLSDFVLEKLEAYPATGGGRPA